MIDVNQLALERNRYPELTDADFRFMLQQIDGRQRTADKLPTFASIEGWQYPVRLSCEQCSSELTARHKAEWIVAAIPAAERLHLVDLTGGYGIDDWFMSEVFEHTDYVEHNTELATIARHNFRLTERKITVHNMDAEAFVAEILPLQRELGGCLIFLDPARRNSVGGKVFRIEDCEPNVMELLPILRIKCSRIMLKLSPMLDITAAIRSLGGDWDVQVVAVKNEVKEILMLSGGTGVITALDLAKNIPFSFTQQEEIMAEAAIASQVGRYLYEPSSAVMKAGSYKLISQVFNLSKLDVNTHLYTSDEKVEHFPGRVWQVEMLLSAKNKLSYKQANVLTRNYPLHPEELKKKLRLSDGGDIYIIGARLKGKPLIMQCKRESTE